MTHNPNGSHKSECDNISISVSPHNKTLQTKLKIKILQLKGLLQPVKEKQFENRQFPKKHKDSNCIKSCLAPNNQIKIKVAGFIRLGKISNDACGPVSRNSHCF